MHVADKIGREFRCTFQGSPVKACRRQIPGRSTPGVWFANQAMCRTENFLDEMKVLVMDQTP